MQSRSLPSAITGLPEPQRATQAVGIPATPALDTEAVLLEHVGQIFRCLDFLVAELAEAEDGVVHHLGELAPRLDALDHGSLELFETRGVAPYALLGERRARCQQHGRQHHSRSFQFHVIPSSGCDVFERKNAGRRAGVSIGTEAVSGHAPTSLQEHPSQRRSTSTGVPPLSSAHYRCSTRHSSTQGGRKHAKIQG